MRRNHLLQSAILRNTLALLVTIFALASLSAQTPPRSDRITQALNSAVTATVPGTVHPLVQRAIDMGALDPALQLDSLTLNISLSAAQQSDLQALLQAQQDPNSPQFRHWLTQEAFGARFGLTDGDLAKITAWLEAQGFTVTGTSGSRNAINFSATVGQVQAAFRTQMHRYNLDGETHIANATELSVPAALASVVLDVRGLDDFRPKANITQAIRAVSPQYTSGSGNHFLSPGDWVTIYDVGPIYTAGYTGTGAHVGIVGQTFVPQGDIDHFRSAAGLPPTLLSYKCISSSNCTNAAGTSTDGDLFESDLDIEWAGGIAKDATIDFIYTSHADTTHNVFDALQYAIQTYRVSGAVVPVLSMSYETCELNITSSQATHFSNLALQANSQGQTIVVSSGDSGAAGCDPHFQSTVTASTLGLAVSVPSDVPNITSVGGTYMNGDQYDPTPYWSSSPGVNTALAYIPEEAWNESGGNGLEATGGGVSTMFPQPSWQWAPSNFSGTSGRFVPDVAFTASANHDGYLICSQVDNSTTYGTTCSDGFLSSTGYLFLSGGTSAGTPSFAGMLALLTQKYGPLGNINLALYSLASSSTTYASVFHDTTTGNNVVPCVPAAPGCVNGQLGYQATTGYDLPTGLGSVDGGAFYAAMASLLRLSFTTTTVTASPTSFSMGATITLSAAVSSTGSGTITGQVTFMNGSINLGTATVSNGVASLTGVQVTPANGFSAGTNAEIFVSYGGDTNFASSGASVAVAPAPLVATTTLVTASPTSLQAQSMVTLTATVASSGSGTPTGTVTFIAGLPCCGYQLGSAALSAGTATLDVAADSGNWLPPGTDPVAATYSGDMDFATSSGSTTLTVTAIPTTTTITVAPATVMMNNPVTFDVTVSSSAALPPYLYFDLSVGTAGAFYSGPVGNPTPHVTVTTQEGFSVGTNTVTATFSANGDFGGSSNTTTLTVTPQPATTTTLTATPSSVAIGGTMTLSATVTSTAPGTPTGSVIFLGCGYIASVPLSNGTASLPNITADASHGFCAGLSSVTANYSGDLNFAPSTGSAAITVTGIPSTTTVSANPASAPLGAYISVTATVASSGSYSPTGTATLKVGSITYGGTGFLTNGTTTWTGVPVTAPFGFALGSNTVTVSYAGDGNVLPSSGSTTVTAAVPTYTLAASPTSISLSPGGTGTVALNLSTASYTGTISFTTTTSSGLITASAPSAALYGPNSTTGSVLTISASTSAANHPRALPWKISGALACAVLFGAAFSLRRKRSVALLISALALLLTIGGVSCGGGGGTGGGGGGGGGRLPRTYSVTVTPTGSAPVTDAAAVTVTVTVQ